jgi:hypothetical protein
MASYVRCSREWDDRRFWTSVVPLRSHPRINRHRSKAGLSDPDPTTGFTSVISVPIESQLPERH